MKTILDYGCGHAGPSQTCASCQRDIDESREQVRSEVEQNRKGSK